MASSRRRGEGEEEKEKKRSEIETFAAIIVSITGSNCGKIHKSREVVVVAACWRKVEMKSFRLRFTGLSLKGVS